MVFVHDRKRQQRHEARFTLFTFDQSHNLSLTAVSNFFFFSIFLFFFAPWAEKRTHCKHNTDLCRYRS